MSSISDTPLPFRPRSEGPVDRALAGIESQAANVRRRLNRFEFGNAVFLAAGASLFSFVGLVALAFVLSPRTFAVAAWALLFAAAAFTLAQAVRLSRGWVSATRAMAIIDRRARLEERLSTLTTAHPSARQSRLWTFLLLENLRLLPRWEPHLVMPRMLPRSVWFFVGALGLASLVLWRLPDVSSAKPVDRSAREHRPPAAEPVPDEQAPEDADRGDDEADSRWAALPEALRQAILGVQSSRNYAGAIPRKTLPVEDDKGGPAIVGSRIGNDGPTRSVPARPDTMRLAGHPQAPRNSLPPPNARAIPDEAGRPSAPAHGDAPKAFSPDATKLHEQLAKSLGKGSPTGVGGGSPGAGTGGDKSGLFGERQARGTAAGSFALDLDALLGGRPDQNGEDEDSGLRPQTELSADQRLDDAVRRAQVPTAYEKIVQRIFSRGSDDGDRPLTEP